MDQRWNTVLKSFLDFPEEIGAVIVSPSKAEIWKGTTEQCPYFKSYQEHHKVIVHSHPHVQRYCPPSSTDLLNCIQSPNPHIVIAKEGFWIYSASPALKEEWGRLNDDQRDTLSAIINNNTFGLVALLVGGKLLENFAEDVTRIQINVEEFCNKMKTAIPRKDPSQPALGFDVCLVATVTDTNVMFDPEYEELGYEWDINDVDSLTNRISETESGKCVTSDGSFVVF